MLREVASAAASTRIDPDCDRGMRRADVGICPKVIDGSFRAITAALAHVLERLGVETRELGDGEMANGHGERVGELRVV